MVTQGNKMMNTVDSCLSKRCLIGLFCFYAIVFFSESACAVVYVDRDRTGGNGTSWSTAYTTLEAAIAGSGDSQEEFWIAEGTYKPVSELKPFAGTSFLGGFNGTETNRNARDINDHPVIVDGQHTLTHIFSIYRDGVRLDGLTIQGGNAAVGGAVFLYNANAAVIEGCIFKDNAAEMGAALYGWKSELTITNCQFDSNRASGGEGSGGAIWLNSGSPKIIDSVFTNNSAQVMGGAVELRNATDALIIGSVFSGNSVTTPGTGGGGAISLQWNTGYPASSVIVENCQFQNNSSGLEGGALYSNRVHVTVSLSTFIGNSAVNGGALMLDYKLSQPSRVKRCLFINNRAVGVAGLPAYGGAICTYVRSIVIENSVFAYNSSANSGGGVRLHAGAGGDYDADYSAVVQNATFYGNQAGTYGGGLQNTGVPMLYLNNSILWNNKGGKTIWDGAAGVFRATNDVFNGASSSMTTHNTDMESLEWYHGSISEEHVDSFSSDPLFVDPDGADGIEGTLDDDFQLQVSSPCIDRSEGDLATECDMDCYPRIDYSNVPNQGTGTPQYADIGALERIENPATSPCSSCSITPPYNPPALGNTVIPPIIYLLLNSYGNGGTI